MSFDELPRVGAPNKLIDEQFAELEEKLVLLVQSPDADYWEESFVYEEDESGRKRRRPLTKGIEKLHLIS